ncbi:hypothetical protein [Tumebacillus flagellatus]|uniref:hypothetical protein n=1 Tax=Tumebacillus flagellatus TaxID=1157490 RepID=UPI0013784395|nr:hypothetical protein [Tumebacillus flagellatus]
MKKVKFALSLLGVLIAVAAVGGTALYYKVLHPEKVVVEQERHFRPAPSTSGTTGP